MGKFLDRTLFASHAKCLAKQEVFIFRQATLARADTTVLLIISEKTNAADSAALINDDLTRIENWLAIRLRTPSVRIIKVKDN